MLKDGASTLYGFDAIAGVANIITRQEKDGSEANAYLGQYGEGDDARKVYDFGERGSATVGVEYTQKDPIWASDRWFSVVRFPTGEKAPSARVV